MKIPLKNIGWIAYVTLYSHTFNIILLLIVHILSLNTQTMSAIPQKVYQPDVLGFDRTDGQKSYGSSDDSIDRASFGEPMIEPDVSVRLDVLPEEFEELPFTPLQLHSSVHVSPSSTTERFNRCDCLVLTVDMCLFCSTVGINIITVLG